ncbi:hypothetical protein DFQ26_008664 [Actinomortierella ambigua]|nr:hypothetical protein DFQ26_008664 [Actinomortierella ambigua]
MEGDLSNASIRTNPGKKDGSGLLTVRDILDDPKLQVVKGASRGGWGGDPSQSRQSQQQQQHQQQQYPPLQQRTRRRPSIPDDGVGQSASSSGSLKASEKLAARRSREPQAEQHHPLQHRTRTSGRPTDIVETTEDNQQAPSDSSMDQSAAVRHFQTRLDEAMRQARQKSASGVNGSRGSRVVQSSLPRTQSTHPTIQQTAIAPSLAKERLKGWAEFTMDDSVYTASVDDQDDGEDDEDDDDDDDDTDVTQKTAERIPSLVRTDQAAFTVPKPRQLPNGNAAATTSAAAATSTPTTTVGSSSTVAKQSRDKNASSRQVQHQHQQRPAVKDRGQGDIDALDDPGYDSADWLDRETALARLRREQAKEQKLRASTSKTARSSPADAKRSNESEQSSSAGPNLLSAPTTTTTTTIISSKAKSKSSAASSSSKSPLISPRLAGVEGGLPNTHRGWSFRRDYQGHPQQPSSAFAGTMLPPLPLLNLSIPPSNLSTNTTTSNATTTHARRKTLDHGRDLALEDLASPTGQDPVMMGGILAGRRGSKKSTNLLAVDEDDHFPRPSIMSSYLRMNETMQPHGYNETEHRFLELAGSIGEGQAVSNVFGTLKDKIRTLKQKQKSSTATVKALQKELKKAQRELARERREKDALSASLTATSAAAPVSRSQNENSYGTKVEQDIESLQQRIETLEQERRLVATKKETLIRQRQKELLFLDSESSDDADGLDNEDSDSDEDDGDEEEPSKPLEEASQTATPQPKKSRRRKGDITQPPPPPLLPPPPPLGKGKERRRDSTTSLESVDIGASAPPAPAPTLSSSLRGSKDSRRGQQTKTSLGEQQPNMVRFEVPLPSNMRASQVVYLPSLSKSLSALAPLSSPLPGTTTTVGCKNDIPEDILSTPAATTAAAAAAAIAALSASSSGTSYHQKDHRELHIHHHVHVKNDKDHGRSSSGDGKVVRTSVPRSGSSGTTSTSTSASTSKGKSKTAPESNSNTGMHTRSKQPAIDPTVIEAIDMLRQSIGRRDGPGAVGGRRSGSTEPVAQQQQQYQQGNDQARAPLKQNHLADSDSRKQDDAAVAVSRGEEQGAGTLSQRAPTTADAAAAAIDGETEEQEGAEHVSDGDDDENPGAEDQSMIDGDVAVRPRRIHIDVERVLSLLKAHHPDRCAVCCNQPSGSSFDHSHHDQPKETAHRVDVRTRHPQPAASERRQQQQRQAIHVLQESQIQSPVQHQQQQRPPSETEEPRVKKGHGSIDRGSMHEQQPEQQQQQQQQQVDQDHIDGDQEYHDEEDIEQMADQADQDLSKIMEMYRAAGAELELARENYEKVKSGKGLLNPQLLAIVEERKNTIEQKMKEFEQVIKTMV